MERYGRYGWVSSPEGGESSGPPTRWCKPAGQRQAHALAAGRVALKDVGQSIGLGEKWRRYNNKQLALWRWPRVPALQPRRPPASTPGWRHLTRWTDSSPAGGW